MKEKSSSQSLLGIIIIGLGIGFLLDALNIWNFSSAIGQWWPVLIIIVGLMSLRSNPKLLAWPLMIIAAGVLLLFKQLNVLEFNVWNLIWPTILIMVGLSFISNRFGGRPKDSSEDKPDMFVAFSGIDTTNKSDNFQGGKATVIFGGISLDLRQAHIKKEATIETFAAFGGIELKVPEGWNVKADGLPLFGGWDNKANKPVDKDAPVLHVRGTCMFGGVEIKN